MAADSMEAVVDTGNSMPGDELTYGRKFMNNENEYLERVQRFWFLWFPGTVGIATVAMLALWVQLSFAQQVAQRTFSSPQQASQALYRAVENQDEQGILQILGGRKELVSSDDEVTDKVEREQFVAKYQEMHRLVHELDGTMVLYIGAENWPFPIPLVSKSGQWYFDADRGAQEILFRRVGENESSAIETCRALVSASNQLGAVRPGQAVPSQSRHGYYFQPVIASDSQRGASNRSVAAAPAFVAYPAQYRASGVMAFIVTRDGSVFEKDLGNDTAKIAESISSGSLDSSWQAVE